MDCHPPLPNPHLRTPQSTPLPIIIPRKWGSGFGIPESPRGLTTGRFYGKLNVVLGFRYRREQMEKDTVSVRINKSGGKTWTIRKPNGEVEVVFGGSV